MISEEKSRSIFSSAILFFVFEAGAKDKHAFASLV